MWVGWMVTSVLRRGCKQFPERKWRQVDVQNGGVVNGKAKQDANQVKLFRGLEAIRIEIAILRVVIINEETYSESAMNADLKGNRTLYLPW
jgi:hypothetical protein